MRIMNDDRGINMFFWEIWYGPLCAALDTFSSQLLLVAMLTKLMTWSWPAESRYRPVLWKAYPSRQSCVAKTYAAMRLTALSRLHECPSPPRRQTQGCFA